MSLSASSSVVTHLTDTTVDNVEYRGPLQDAASALSKIFSGKQARSAPFEPGNMKQDIEQATCDCAKYVRSKHTQRIENLLRESVAFSYGLTRETIAFDAFPDPGHELSAVKNGLDASLFAWELFPPPPYNSLLTRMRRTILPMSLLIDDAGHGRLTLHKKDASGQRISSTTCPLLDEANIHFLNPVDVVRVLRLCPPTVNPTITHPRADADKTHKVDLEKDGVKITLHFEHAVSKANATGEVPLETLPINENVIIEHSGRFYVNRIGAPLCLTSIQYDRRIDKKRQHLVNGRWINRGSVFVLDAPVTYLNLAAPAAHSDSVALMLDLIDNETARIRKVGVISSSLSDCTHRCRRMLVHSFVSGARCAFNENSVAKVRTASDALVSTRLGRLYGFVLPLDIPEKVWLRSIVRGVLRRVIICLTFYEIVNEMHVLTITGPDKTTNYGFVDNVSYDASSVTSPFRPPSRRLDPISLRQGDPYKTSAQLDDGQTRFDFSHARVNVPQTPDSIFPALDRIERCEITAKIALKQIDMRSDMLVLHDDTKTILQVAIIPAETRPCAIEINAPCSTTRVRSTLDRTGRVLVQKKVNQGDKTMVDISASDIQKLSYSDDDFEISKGVLRDDSSAECPSCVDLGKRSSYFKYDNNEQHVRMSDRSSSAYIYNTQLLDGQFVLSEPLTNIGVSVDVDMRRRTAVLSLTGEGIALTIHHHLDPNLVADLISTRNNIGSSVIEGGRKVCVENGEKQSAFVSNALELASMPKCNIFHLVKERVRRLDLAPSVASRINLRDRALLQIDSPVSSIIQQWIDRECETISRNVNLVDSSGSTINLSPVLIDADEDDSTVFDNTIGTFWQTDVFFDTLDAIERQVYLSSAQINEALRRQGKLAEAQRLVFALVSPSEPPASSMKDASLVRPSVHEVLSLLHGDDKPAPDESAVEYRSICGRLKKRIDARADEGVSLASIVDDIIDRDIYMILSSVFLSMTEMRLPAPKDAGTLVGANDETQKVWNHTMNASSYATAPKASRSETAVVAADSAIRMRLNARTDAEAEMLMSVIIGVADDAQDEKLTSKEQRDRRRVVWQRLTKHFYLDSSLKNNFNVFRFGNRHSPFPEGASSLSLEHYDPLIMALLCVTVNRRPYLAAQLDPNVWGGEEVHAELLRTNMVPWDRFVEAGDADAAENREELMASLRSKLA